MAMLNLLGDKPVGNCYLKSFGKGWKEDAVKHMGLKSCRDITADYGHLPNLSTTNPDHNILFTYDGTTSGVRVPNLDWISDPKQGITFNDATSSAFAMDMEWSNCDVTTYS
jgi:phosphoserine aminotransferase